jgi:hypothetical protein
MKIGVASTFVEIGNLDLGRALLIFVHHKGPLRKGESEHTVKREQLRSKVK